MGIPGTWEGDRDDALGIGADGSSPTMYTFPSGSPRLLLELQPRGTFMCGTLTFGEGAPAPCASGASTRPRQPIRSSGLASRFGIAWSRRLRRDPYLSPS